MTDEAVAFVPGHVTGFFSAHHHENPAVAGSRGAGVALTDGVRVTVRRPNGDGDATAAADGSAPLTTLNGERLSMPPVDLVRRELGVPRATVVAETPLPLGAGFGVSGAMALGTAYAANAVFDGRRSENELVGVAHRAEVEAGTGLGDVVAQARGGLPIRLEPGAPDHGALDGIPARPRVEYVTFGEVSTADVLSGDTTALTGAGERALSDLRERPTPERFVALSRRFAREAELATERVSTAVADARAADGDAAMAMLGDTVFAFGTDLSDAGYDPVVCGVHPSGSALVSDRHPYPTRIAPLFSSDDTEPFMSDIEVPESHPRYLSLLTRHRIEEGVEKGITSKQGLIAEGRGEAFDYLLGEETIPSADAAERAAAAQLLLASHPVLSVNGNVAALVPEEMVELADAVDADLEVNLFNRTDERMRAIVDHLRAHGADEVKGLTADARIPNLDHERAKVDADGIGAADVVLVPLEDGDRAEALAAMGKVEIVVDLNPLSRSAQSAAVPIIDNILRAVPNVTAHARDLRDAPREELERVVEEFDREAALRAAEDAIRGGRLE